MSVMLRRTTAEEYSDLLQMKLVIDKTKVKGTKTVSIDLKPLKIPFKLDVVAAFESEPESGLLLKGPGQFYAFIGSKSDFEPGDTTLLILNGVVLSRTICKNPREWLDGTDSFDAAIDLFSDGTHATFVKDGEGVWSKKA